MIKTSKTSKTQLQQTKKLPKGKWPRLPKVFNGMYGSQPELGGFIFRQEGSDFRAEWQHCGKARKSALFSELCQDINRTAERQDLGLLIAALADNEAQKIMNAIGGPNEAISYSAPARKIAKSWRTWAMSQASEGTAS